MDEQLIIRVEFAASKSLQVEEAFQIYFVNAFLTFPVKVYTQYPNIAHLFKYIHFNLFSCVLKSVLVTPVLNQDVL